MTKKQAIQNLKELLRWYLEEEMLSETVYKREAVDMAISALSENKDGWIPFSKELPPKGTKVHVSTFGIVTIGERTSEANEKLRLSILEPMNNRYTNIDPYDYQITRWQPLPEAYKGES